jgi:acyl-CoA synthetase (AMP-forming)/AMP-acid ligase II
MNGLVGESQKTLDDFLREYSSSTPEAPAVTDYRTSRTFAELDAAADGVAQALARSGVVRGDRVAVLDQNGMEIIELLFGCSRTGAILVPLNYRLTPTDIAGILRSIEPRVLVVHRDFREDAGQALGQAGLDPEVVVIDDDRGAGYREWVETAGGVAVEASAQGPADALCMSFTSGSTGEPKGVVLRQSGFTMYHRATADEWAMDENAVNIVALPLFHIGAISWFTGSFVVGAPTVILRRADPGEILDAIQQHGGTHINVVPAILQMMLHEQKSRPRDVSSFRVVTAGGSPVPASYLREALEVFGCTVFAFFGLSEAGGGVAHARMETSYIGTELEARLVSAGRPMHGVRLSIRDIATGEELAAGEAGEIVVQSPGVMLEYWGRPDVTAAAFTEDGWLRTGDVGKVDEDGFLYIFDRLKDIIISGGENIYASEVEGVISEYPKVLEVSVVGVPHETWGETPKAFVVPDEGVELTERDVLQYARGHMAHYKCPTIVEIVESLPKTATGKIDKVSLKPR